MLPFYLTALNYLQHLETIFKTKYLPEFGADTDERGSIFERRQHGKARLLILQRRLLHAMACLEYRSPALLPRVLELLDENCERWTFAVPPSPAHGCVQNWQTSQGSFSAVSKPNFASK